VGCKLFNEEHSDELRTNKYAEQKETKNASTRTPVNKEKAILEVGRAVGWWFDILSIPLQYRQHYMHKEANK
jgi:hypothetical protein